jgi:hypothetical protein
MWRHAPGQRRAAGGGGRRHAEHRHAAAQREREAAEGQQLAVGALGFDPGREGEAGGRLQRGVAGLQAAVAVEPCGAADQAAGHRRRGAAEHVVARARAVLRQAAGLAQVVHGPLRGVVEAGGRHRLRGFVAVVQPDVLRRVAPGQARHLYPHEGEFVGAVEALDVVRQHGLLVLGHEAQVGRGLVGREEIEIAGGQAHQHRHARGLGGDAGGLGVQGDLLADGPGLVPPRLGGEGQHQQADSEGEETFHGKGIKRPAHARAGPAQKGKKERWRGCYRREEPSIRTIRCRSPARPRAPPTGAAPRPVPAPPWPNRPRPG